MINWIANVIGRKKETTHTDKIIALGEQMVDIINESDLETHDKLNATLSVYTQFFVDMATSDPEELDNLLRVFDLMIAVHRKYLESQRSV